MKARRGVDSSRSSALTMALVSKMKRTFPERRHSKRTEESRSGSGSPKIRARFLSRDCGIGMTAKKRLHLPLVASGRRS